MLKDKLTARILGAGAALLPMAAFATDPTPGLEEVLAAVSFGTVLTTITALLVSAIGIRLAFKGFTFGKRVINGA